MEVPITFGEWLRLQRSDLWLTRKEFTSRIGCSVSTLRKIEHGQRRPSRQIAVLITNCLNIPIADRLTFVKVARGNLSVDRLYPGLKRAVHPSISPTSIIPQTCLPVLPTPVIGGQHEWRCSFNSSTTRNAAF